MTWLRRVAVLTIATVAVLVVGGALLRLSPFWLTGPEQSRRFEKLADPPHADEFLAFIDGSLESLEPFTRELGKLAGESLKGDATAAGKFRATLKRQRERISEIRKDRQIIAVPDSDAARELWQLHGQVIDLTDASLTLHFGAIADVLEDPNVSNADKQIRIATELRNAGGMLDETRENCRKAKEAYLQR